MLGDVLTVDEDWTSVIDDIDRYGLEQGCPLVPPSQLHRGESALNSNTVLMSDTQEESKEAQQEEKLNLIVQMVPAFGLKELSVYADADQLIQTGKRYTFELPESVFNAIDVDDSKCQKYRKDSTQMKIVINYKSNLETCEYDKYISHLLEHISGVED